MNALFLSIIYIFSGCQSICLKSYNKRVGNKGIYTWVAMLSLSAALFFIINSGGKIVFEPFVLVYSTLFAICYAAASIGNAVALRHGPLSLTTLMMAYSLMIPTVYGMIFLDEKPSIYLLIGLVLLILSLFMINYRKNNDNEQRITKKWLFFAIIALVGNGMCSTTQKMQQLAFDGEYKNEFMIYALLILAVISSFLSIVTARKEAVTEIKNGWYLALTAGVMNGGVNLLVMILGGRMPVSIMFPLISAGQIVVSYVISRFIYKECLSKLQLAGVATGVVSIVLFNL